MATIKKTARAPVKKSAAPLLWTILVGLVLVLAIGIGFGLWYRTAPRSAAENPVSFATIGPIVVQQKSTVVSAIMAVQVRAADVEWAHQNEAKIAAVLQQELEGVDPHLARNPKAADALQEKLRAAVTSALKTDRIEQILFTEFLFQAD